MWRKKTSTKCVIVFPQGIAAVTLFADLGKVFFSGKCFFFLTFESKPEA
jgi:hypothetical protein